MGVGGLQTPARAQALGARSWVQTQPQGTPSPGVFGRVVLGLHQGTVNEHRCPRAESSEGPIPISRVSAQELSGGRVERWVRSPPIYLSPPPTYFSHGHLTVHVRFLSQIRGLSANPGPSVSTRLEGRGRGLRPTDPAALSQWGGRPGPASWLSFLSFLSLFSLTKDHRKRPKYNKLLVSTQDPSQPPSKNPYPIGGQGRDTLVLSPTPLGPQEHSFIKRYETLEVDVASWFKDVMAKTESPRTSGVLSQHHLPFFR